MYLLTTSQWLYMGVSENNGTPKSSILIGFSIINHPFWGTTSFGTTHIDSTVELQPFGATAKNGSLFSQISIKCLTQLSNDAKHKSICTHLDTKLPVIKRIHFRKATWWFQTCFIFTFIWGNDPIWLIFFKCVETTNQKLIHFLFDWSRLNPLNPWFFTTHNKAPWNWVLNLNRHFFSGNTKKNWSAPEKYGWWEDQSYPFLGFSPLSGGYFSFTFYYWTSATLWFIRLHFVRPKFLYAN